MTRSYRPIILCYHRISDSTSPDINRLSVSPKNFISHLKYLSTKRKFVPLEEMVTSSTVNTVSVTFDDGYRDNFTTAANILSDLNIPASFFLATRFIKTSTNYYPSSLNAIWNFYTAQKLIPEIIRDSPIEKLLREEVNYFRALHKLSSNRPEILWELSKILDVAQHSSGPVDELEMPMSISEVTSLISNSLFSIGPHTATHPRLSAIPAAEAVLDFAESVSTVEKWGASKTTYFPYPFGQSSDFNAMLESEIKTSFNFRGLSTFPTAIGRNQMSASTLPRLSVQDWEIDKFRRIVNSANAFSYVPMVATFALKASSILRRFRQT